MSEQMNQMLSDSGLPLYEKAVVFAAIAHQGAHRKGSRIPYLSHPIEAAAIVSELTDDEQLIEVTAITVSLAYALLKPCKLPESFYIFVSFFSQYREKSAISHTAKYAEIFFIAAPKILAKEYLQHTQQLL